jgi:hypothetical protein
MTDAERARHVRYRTRRAVRRRILRKSNAGC